ncbi:MAG: PD40 domain-containing protein [Acidobacteria bacterium]|nr:PD40 domain-containing protein [Acidobacteriota bacterium]MBI3263579.1 PD40 domain-containing protein [Acidobacteriota bacterium]
MTLTSGTRLGPYEIRASLGAGGMGEVYRAHDSKLGREVAIKVLPEAFSNDAERLARFEREAHVLASVSHPNVAGIFGLEEAAGTRYLVLELVPGDTLADRVAAGRVELEEGLRICCQIAAALEATHEKGVIHRDLKPANIKVTPNGTVKVLDYGLAKIFPVDVAGPASSPTMSIGGTADGVLMGTAAYMSPEQARGKSVDRRTDIWSFGCVLFEVLSARKAFDGSTVSDMIAAILGGDPDWTALPAATPPGIRRLLRRCLQRDLARRLHDIVDARLEIEEALASPLATDVPDAPSRALHRPWAVIAGVGILGAVLGGALLAGLERARAGSAVPPTLVLTQAARLTHDPLLSEWPAWSPDGRLIAFTSNRGGNFDVYVRRVEGGQEVNITNDASEDIQPAFSPNGESIAFVSTRSSRTGMVKIGNVFGMEFRTYGGDVWVVPALGGRARRLGEDGNFPVWHPSGNRIAYVSGRENHRSILEIAPEGGPPKPLLPSESSNWEITRLQYSPDGSWVSFETVGPERVLLMPATGGTPHELLTGTTHVWSPSGRRVYYLTPEPLGGTRLESADLDARNGTLQGAPHPVAIMTGILRDLAISRDGQHFALSEQESSLNLTRLPLNAAGDAPAGAEEVLSTGQVIDRFPSFSRDGQRVAFASDRLGRVEIWLLDLRTRKQERLQLPGEDRGQNLAFWTPDGRQIIVTRYYQSGAASLWVAAVDGSRAEVLVPATPGLAGSPVSPDGRTVLYSARVGSYLQLFALDLATRKARQLTTTADDKSSAAWSPDGREIAYTSNASGALQTWIIPASGGEPRRLTSGSDRIRHVFYSPDGRWLYFQPNHQNVFRIPASGGPPRAITAFPASGLFLEEPTISPDGRYLLYCRSMGGASLWTLTLGSPARP